MNAFNLLGYLASFVLGCVLVYVFKPFLGSYSAKKGENLATKEDIAQITKVQEEIKAKISGDIWGLQRQWELKRDVVLDSVRTLADLEGAVHHYIVVCSMPYENTTKEARDTLLVRRIEAIKQRGQCSASYQRAHTIADVAIGGELSRNLLGYFRYVLTFDDKMLSEMKPSDKRAAQKELAKWHNRVILSARGALGIKDAGDLPVLDYDNESLTANN